MRYTCDRKIIKPHLFFFKQKGSNLGFRYIINNDELMNFLLWNTQFAVVK